MNTVKTGDKTPTIFQIAAHMTLRALVYASLAGIAFAFVAGVTGAVSALTVVALLRAFSPTSYTLSGVGGVYELTAYFGAYTAVITGTIGAVLVFVVLGFQSIPPAQNVQVFFKALRGAWLGSNTGLVIGAFVGFINGGALKLVFSPEAVLRLPIASYIQAAGGSADRLWDAALMGAVNGIALGYFLGLLTGAWCGGKHAMAQPR